MKKLFCDTAILLFTRDAHAESTAKKFHSDKHKNRSVSSLLISHSIDVSEQSGLDLIVIDQYAQRGNNFADRLCNAFQDVFLKGYANVIAIGNDTPSLTVNDILNAAGRLDQKEFVLGPSSDGGIYLLGITKQHFDRLDFSAVSWGSAKVCHELKQVFSRINDAPLFFLEEKDDIDNSEDLTLVFSSCHNSKIIRILKRILDTFEVFPEIIQRFSPGRIQFSFGLKAPPAQ